MNFLVELCNKKVQARINVKLQKHATIQWTILGLALTLSIGMRRLRGAGRGVDRGRSASGYGNLGQMARCPAGPDGETAVSSEPLD